MRAGLSFILLHVQKTSQVLSLRSTSYHIASLMVSPTILYLLKAALVSAGFGA